MAQSDANKLVHGLCGTVSALLIAISLIATDLVVVSTFTKAAVFGGGVIGALTGIAIALLLTSTIERIVRETFRWKGSFVLGGVLAIGLIGVYVLWRCQERLASGVPDDTLKRDLFFMHFT